MADVEIKYNNATIASLLDSGTEVLETDGKICEDDITITYTKPSLNLQSKSASPTTSSQTITADSGYDGLSQVTVNAISPTKAAQTYTPTTTDQTIQSGRWLTGAQTIKGDANLVAGNIKKDVQIFNVTGTYDGPVVPNVNAKDVNFIDYDGTLLYSYTASEFAALTALPANPSHTGLTAQGWNWSLSDAKTYVASYGKLWIGQMYITTSGDTEIDIELHAPRLSPYLGIAVNGTVEVDWGDGSTKSTVTGTSLATQIRTGHIYTTDGSYTIKIHVVSGSFSLYGTSTYAILSGNFSSVNNNRVYANNVQRVRIGSSMPSIGAFVFYYCSSLASITIPSNVTSISSGLFNGCSSLASITIPSNVTSIISSSFSSCPSLASITIPSNVTSIGSSSFHSCSSLASITIPSNVTSIGSSSFTNCYGLGLIRFEPTTPPTVSNSNAWTNVSTDCIILIPYNASGLGSQYLDNYIDATNYPLSNTYKYIGYATFANNTDLGEYVHTSGGLELKWYASLNDAVTETNRISRGNGNEIYCSISSGAI